MAAQEICNEAQVVKIEESLPDFIPLRDLKQLLDQAGKALGCKVLTRSDVERVLGTQMSSLRPNELMIVARRDDAADPSAADDKQKTAMATVPQRNVPRQQSYEGSRKRGVTSQDGNIEAAEPSPPEGKTAGAMTAKVPQATGSALQAQRRVSKLQSRSAPPFAFAAGFTLRPTNRHSITFTTTPAGARIEYEGKEQDSTTNIEILVPATFLQKVRFHLDGYLPCSVPQAQLKETNFHCDMKAAK